MRLTTILALAVMLAAAGRQAPAPAIWVRLHHMHYLTGNVSEALSESAKRHGGTRVLLQGLGVGVRLDDRYVLFDINSAVETAGTAAARPPEAPPAGDVSDIYRTAVQWLAQRGVAVTPEELGLTRLAAMLPDEHLDHVAFAAANLDTAVQVLRASGAVEARRTTDSVYYRAGSTVIEMTRDTDLPDLLWCPMHPNVRAPAAGKCPICTMDLVPIPPPRLGEYPVDVSYTAGPGEKRPGTLTLRIRDPETGEPVNAFVSLHERLLHLFVISRDLRVFAHEHPVQSGDRFELPIDLAPGAYMLLADFLPAGGSPQMVHRALLTPDAKASPFAAPPVGLEPDLADKVVDGVRMQLTVDSRRDRLEAVLRFRFTDAKTGAPIADLQPYLGVSGHLLIVNADLTHAVHAHPEGVTAGPDINFGAEFPVAGLYKVWVQVQRQERVFTAPFVLRIGEP